MRRLTLQFYSKHWVLLCDRPIMKSDGTLNGLYMCGDLVFTFSAEIKLDSFLKGLEYFVSTDPSPLPSADANRPLRDRKFVSLNELGVELAAPPRSYPYVCFQIDGSRVTGEAHPNCSYSIYQQYHDLGRYNEIWKPLDFHFENLEQVAGLIIEWAALVKKWKVEPI